MAKKKLDDLTQCKLIYSGELLIFAVVFVVLGLLFLFGVIKVADWKKWFFTILTLVGGIWVFIDFFWTLKSEKKRKKNSLLDKVLLLPNGAIIFVIDIFTLVMLIKDPSWTGFYGVNFFQYLIGGAVLYCALVLGFEAIYHYFHIHPMVYQILEEAKEKEAQEQSENDAKGSEENKEK